MAVGLVLSLVKPATFSYGYEYGLSPLKLFGAHLALLAALIMASYDMSEEEDRKGYSRLPPTQA